MYPDLAGFIGLAALMVALAAWLRADMNGRMDRIDERLDGFDGRTGRTRLARVETLLDGVLPGFAL